MCGRRLVIPEAIRDSFMLLLKTSIRGCEKYYAALDALDIVMTPGLIKRAP